MSDEMQNCQVELTPGSGVFVSGLFYARCLEQPATDGSQLVRQLVKEVFRDDEILSGATCTGKTQQWPRTKEILGERKVSAIEGMHARFLALSINGNIDLRECALSSSLVDSLTGSLTY